MNRMIREENKDAEDSNEAGPQRRARKRRVTRVVDFESKCIKTIATTHDNVIAIPAPIKPKWRAVMPISSWDIVVGTSVIVAIGVSFLKAKKYIDDKVSEALSKDEIIQKISLLIKPDLIFDEDESIISDRGASSLIKERGISVTISPFMGFNVPTEISISFNKHLTAPPLLTPLNPDSVHIQPRRGTEHTWIYKLTYSGIDISDDTGKPTKKIYRLEIL